MTSLPSRSVTGSPEYMNDTHVKYQEKYRVNAPERDKVLLALIKARLADEKQGELLDIGCHQGNLLFQLKENLPGWILEGGDLFSGVIEFCNQDPELSSIRFSVMDILSMPLDRKWDVIIANAVVFRFAPEDFEIAVRNISGSLNPGGLFFGLDFYHDFEQNLRIEERTPEHPEGLLLHIRSKSYVQELLLSLGFRAIDFYPFEIPIDLPLSHPSNALHTHTRQALDGKRLQFRGSIYEPWCHLVAKKG
jgi:SAM-dependent methyltransferase